MKTINICAAYSFTPTSVLSCPSLPKVKQRGNWCINEVRWVARICCAAGILTPGIHCTLDSPVDFTVYCIQNKLQHKLHHCQCTVIHKSAYTWTMLIYRVFRSNVNVFSLPKMSANGNLLHFTIPKCHKAPSMLLVSGLEEDHLNLLQLQYVNPFSLLFCPRINYNTVDFWCNICLNIMDCPQWILHNRK